MCNSGYNRSWKENLLIIFRIRKQCGKIDLNKLRCQFLAKRESDFCPWSSAGIGDDIEVQKFSIEYNKKCSNYYEVTN